MPLGSSKIAVNKNKPIGGQGFSNVTLIVSTVETLTNSHTVQYAVTSNIPSITLKYKIETNLTGLDFENGSVDGTVNIDANGDGSFEVQLLDGYYTGPSDPQFKTNITRDSGVVVKEGNVHLITAVEPLQISGGTSSQQANIDGNIFTVVNLTTSLSSETDQNITMTVTDLGDYSSYSGAPLEMQVLIAGGGGGTDAPNVDLPTFNTSVSTGTYTFQPWEWMGLAGGAGGEHLQFTVPFANLSLTSYSGTIGKGGAIGNSSTNYVGGTGGNTTFLGETVAGGPGAALGQYLDTNPAADYSGGTGGTATTAVSPARSGGDGASGGAAGQVKDYRSYPFANIRRFRSGIGGDGLTSSGLRGTEYDPSTHKYGGGGGTGDTSGLISWFIDLTTLNGSNTNVSTFASGGGGSAWVGDPLAAGGGASAVWSMSYDPSDLPRSGGSVGIADGTGSAYHAQGGTGITTNFTPISTDSGDKANVTITPSIGNSGTIQVRFPYFAPTRSITS